MDLKTNLTELARSVDGYITRLMEQEHLPGLAVGIWHQGKPIVTNGYGWADVERKVPVTPQTVFRIGSITKAFTAVALLQQWEQGKFQLDDPIMQYLPPGHKPIASKDPAAPPVTFQHLLTHTSGIGELKAYSDILHLGTGAYFISPANGPLRPLSGLFDMGVWTNVPPGSKYAYSNHGYSLLGHLVEVLSGEPYHEYVLNHIIKPLGMDHTDVVRSDRVVDCLANGYKVNFRKRQFKAKKYIDSWVRPAGNIMAPLEDLVKFAQVLLGRGTLGGATILKPATVEKIMQPQLQLAPRLPGYGYGLCTDSIGGTTVRFHGGHTIGFNCSFYVIPEHALTVIVLMNTTRKKMTYRISRELARRALGVPAPQVPLLPPEVLRAKDYSPGKLEEYVGTYGVAPGFLTNIRTFIGGGEYRVRVKSDHLVLQTLWGVRKRGVRLWPSDPANAEEFGIVEDVDPYTADTVERLIFDRDPASRRVVGFKKDMVVWRRREGVHSLKFKLVASITIAFLLISVGILLRIVRS